MAREWLPIGLVGSVGSGKKTILPLLKHFCSRLVKEKPEYTKCATDSVSYTTASFDIGKSVRILPPVWANYLIDCYGFIYVLDASQHDSLSREIRQLRSLVKDARACGKPVLVFANKQDLPGVMSPGEVEAIFDLKNSATAAWRVMGSAAKKSGEGDRGDKRVGQGLAWLIDNIRESYEMIKSKIKRDKSAQTLIDSIMVDETSLLLNRYSPFKQDVQAIVQRLQAFYKRNEPEQFSPDMTDIDKIGAKVSTLNRQLEAVKTPKPSELINELHAVLEDREDFRLKLLDMEEELADYKEALEKALQQARQAPEAASESPEVEQLKERISDLESKLAEMEQAASSPVGETEAADKSESDSPSSNDATSSPQKPEQVADLERIVEQAKSEKVELQQMLSKLQIENQQIAVLQQQLKAAQSTCDRLTQRIQEHEKRTIPQQKPSAADDSAVLAKYMSEAAVLAAANIVAEDEIKSLRTKDAQSAAELTAKRQAVDKLAAENASLSQATRTYEQKISELKAQADALITELAQHKTELAQHKTELAQHKTELSQHKATADGLRKHNADLQRSVSELQPATASASQELDVQKERVRSLTRELSLHREKEEDVNRQLGQARQIAVELKAELDAVKQARERESSRSTISPEVEDLQRQLKDRQQSLDALREDMERMQQKLQQVRAERDEREAQLRVEQKAAREAKEAARIAGEENESLLRQRSNLQQQIRELESGREDIHSHASQASRRLEELERDKQVLSSAFDAISTAVIQDDAAIFDTRSKLDQALRCLSSIQNENSSLKGTVASLKTDLAAKQAESRQRMSDMERMAQEVASLKADMEVAALQRDEARTRLSLAAKDAEEKLRLVTSELDSLRQHRDSLKENVQMHEDLKQQAKRLGEEVVALRASRDVLEERMARDRPKLERLQVVEAQLDVSQRERDALKAQVNALEADVMASKYGAEQATAMRRQYENRCSALGELNQVLDGKLENATTQLSDARRLLASLTSETCKVAGVDLPDVQQASFYLLVDAVRKSITQMQGQALQLRKEVLEVEGKWKALAVERDAVSSHLNDVLRQFSDLNARHIAVNTQLQEAERHASTCGVDKETSQKRIQTIQQELSWMEEKLQKASRDRDAVHSQLTLVEAERRKLEGQLQILQMDRDSITKELHAISSKRTLAEDKGVLQELEQTRGRCIEMKQELGKLQSQLHDAEHKLHLAEQTKADLAEQLARAEGLAKSHQEQSREQMQKLRGLLGELDQEVQHMRRERDTQDVMRAEALLSAQTGLAQAQMELDAARKELAVREKDRESLKSECARLGEELQRVKASKDTIGSRLVEAEKLQAEYEQRLREVGDEKERWLQHADVESRRRGEQLEDQKRRKIVEIEQEKAVWMEQLGQMRDLGQMHAAWQGRYSDALATVARLETQLALTTNALAAYSEHAKAHMGGLEDAFGEQYQQCRAFVDGKLSVFDSRLDLLDKKAVRLIIAIADSLVSAKLHHSSWVSEVPEDVEGIDRLVKWTDEEAQVVQGDLAMARDDVSSFVGTLDLSNKGSTFLLDKQSFAAVQNRFAALWRAALKAEILAARRSWIKARMLQTKRNADSVNLLNAEMSDREQKIQTLQKMVAGLREDLSRSHNMIDALRTDLNLLADENIMLRRKATEKDGRAGLTSAQSGSEFQSSLNEIRQHVRSTSESLEQDRGKKQNSSLAKRIEQLESALMATTAANKDQAAPYPLSSKGVTVEDAELVRRVRDLESALSTAHSELMEEKQRSAEARGMVAELRGRLQSAESSLEHARAQERQAAERLYDVLRQRDTLQMQLHTVVQDKTREKDDLLNEIRGLRQHLHVSSSTPSPFHSMPALAAGPPGGDDKALYRKKPNDDLWGSPVYRYNPAFAPAFAATQRMDRVKSTDNMARTATGNRQNSPGAPRNPSSPPGPNAQLSSTLPAYRSPSPGPNDDNSAQELSRTCSLPALAPSRGVENGIPMSNGLTQDDSPHAHPYPQPHPQQHGAPPGVGNGGGGGGEDHLPTVDSYGRPNGTSARKPSGTGTGPGVAALVSKRNQVSASPAPSQFPYGFAPAVTTSPLRLAYQV